MNKGQVVIDFSDFILHLLFKLVELLTEVVLIGRFMSIIVFKNRLSVHFLEKVEDHHDSFVDSEHLLFHQLDKSLGFGEFLVIRLGWEIEISLFNKRDEIRVCDFKRLDQLFQKLSELMRLLIPRPE